MTEVAKQVSFEQEQLRLVSGYNDIFVGIACIITFVSLTTLLEAKYLDQIIVIGSAFGLAWYFVRRQRMRLTGIVIATAVAISGLVLGIEFFIRGFVIKPPLPGIESLPTDIDESVFQLPIVLPFVIALLSSAVFSFGFWRFASVPFAHALGIAAILLTILVAVVGTQVELTDMNIPGSEINETLILEPRSLLEILRTFPFLITTFICGCFAEAYAIWWDVRDPKRRSVATDTAFWTHVVAAPFLIQPLFWWAQLLAWNPTTEIVFGFLLFFLLLLFALVINRRALLIGAMVWVLAMLFTIADMAVAGLTMGVMLLFIAAVWNKTRQLIEPILPEFVQRSFPTLLSDS
ncbi:MAG: hypothetical protein OXG05_14260 [Gammaproteobacteria bacterium]|nr:hypothetical protein [Gammaproteobacteria bacterium]